LAGAGLPFVAAAPFFSGAETGSMESRSFLVDDVPCPAFTASPI
jgi:hypothetical protein